MKTWWTLLAGAAVLAGCGEKPQTLGGGTAPDAPAHAGTQTPAFMAPNWQAGDRVSWEQQLRARGQYGQNDYTRAN